MKKIAVLGVLAFGCMLAGSANAARFGLAIGVPLWGPGYYGPPAYYSPPAYYPPPVYYPSPVYEASPPPVLVQQSPAQENYWYFCKESKGYYPYVQTCPSNWMKVVPSGPNGAPPQ